MASGEHESDKQRFRLFLPALSSLRVGIHTVCAMFVWEHSTLGQLSRELTVRMKEKRICLSQIFLPDPSVIPII